MELEAHNRTAIHIIRNPLDMIVSAYYSHLHSHPADGWPELARQREVLRRVTKEAGLLATWVFLERSDFYDGAVGPLFSLRRWNFDDGNFKTLRMEDLVISSYELLQRETQYFFCDDLNDVIAENSFEKLSDGRAVGIVDTGHHYRSGETHQWLKEVDLSFAHVVYQEYKNIMDAFYPEVAYLLTEKMNN
ncbi:MAG: hypothetical protein MN733_06285 [Nitrososphaera sp.]|nr:hypothetical protein [Nitrososphaera sp.]